MLYLSSYFPVEELQCLAVWKEGNSRYLVGKVHHSHATSNEDRFRCFVYEKASPASEAIDGVEYRVAQSGDATCNGLSSATEGSRTMTLKKGNCSLLMALIKCRNLNNHRISWIMRIRYVFIFMTIHLLMEVYYGWDVKMQLWASSMSDFLTYMCTTFQKSFWAYKNLRPILLHIEFVIV